jgi:hypothetical protein
VINLVKRNCHGNNQYIETICKATLLTMVKFFTMLTSTVTQYVRNVASMVTMVSINRMKKYVGFHGFHCYAGYHGNYCDNCSVSYYLCRLTVFRFKPWLQDGL